MEKGNWEGEGCFISDLLLGFDKNGRNFREGVNGLWNLGVFH
jgi:hypothetical protein